MADENTSTPTGTQSTDGGTGTTPAATPTSPAAQPAPAAQSAGGAEDVTKVDTSKFDDAQKNDYIDKLKDENARRRIENKKLKDAQTKQESDLAATKQQLAELTAKVGEYSQKEKERTDAEKSEIERLSGKITDLEKSISERDAKLQTLESEKAANTLKLQAATRENMVDRLARQLNIEFASDFERKGLMSELLATKEGDFMLSDDEVIYKVNALAKERKKTPSTPGPGPQSRTTGTPLTEEIKTLLAKPTLTREDQQRLDELSVALEKEAYEETPV